LLGTIGANFDSNRPKISIFKNTERAPVAITRSAANDVAFSLNKHNPAVPRPETPPLECLKQSRIAEIAGAAERDFG
jgi:hypothetical protein